MPGVQSWVRLPGHEPWPSQNSRSVAVFLPASQEAVRHSVFWPGKVHDVLTLPLQKPSQPVASPGQPGREPTGLPMTAVQVPADVGRLHASH
jgi:hypothetical protein